MNVSVCIPTYNQASYIEKAIRSALSQTYPPFEIIVSDDCSTDNTREILKLLKAEITILKVIHQPVNLGISKNTDFCLRSANSEFVLRLDSDDYLLPNYISELINLFNIHPDAGYAHAAVQEVDKDGNFLKVRRLARKSGFQTGVTALKAAVKGYRVAANIVMFKRSALEKVGFIVAETNFAEDYYLSASLAANGFGNIYMDEILSCYRVWLDTGRVRQKRKLVEIIGFRKVFEEVMEPAFKKNGWNLGTLNNRRTDFVCTHAVCLAWNIYTKDEKQQLVDEFKKLSDTPRAKLFIWLYLNGFGKIVDIFINITSFPKIIIKKAFLLIKEK
jgi:glycosyltransferase involved in cell wall biosynthesis